MKPLNLVERLRSATRMNRYGGRFKDPDKLKAADRIEKLEAKIKRLREELEDAINLCADSRIVDIPGLGPYHRVDVSEATIDEWRKALEGE